MAVGDVVEFLVTVVNAGTAEAPATTISDTLPDGLVPVDVEPGCSAAGQTITCGPFPFGAQTGVPVTVRARVTPAAAERTLTNTATATTSAPDVNPANNAASADVTVGPYSTLTVSKTADSPTVVAGSTASFTATVRNEGPSAAGGVSLTDVLPDGLTLRSATPSQGTCAGAACDLGGLAAGATAQVRIVADVAPSLAGRRVNAVEVAAATPSAPARAEAPFEIGSPGAAAAAGAGGQPRRGRPRAVARDRGRRRHLDARGGQQRARDGDGCDPDRGDEPGGRPGRRPGGAGRLHRAPADLLRPGDAGRGRAAHHFAGPAPALPRPPQAHGHRSRRRDRDHTGQQRQPRQPRRWGRAARG